MLLRIVNPKIRLRLELEKVLPNLFLVKANCFLEQFFTVGSQSVVKVDKLESLEKTIAKFKLLQKDLICRNILYTHLNQVRILHTTLFVNFSQTNFNIASQFFAFRSRP